LAPSSRKIPQIGLHWVTAVIVAIAVTLFSLCANRGIDLTDESYYLLQYAYWNEYNHHLTFFAAYLDLVFRLFSGSVALIRIFGALLLCASGVVFARELHRYFLDALGESTSDRMGVGPWGAAGALMFFGFMWTLRAPSYNTLTLAGLLVSTGLLFRICRDRNPPGRIAFLYGLCMAVVAFNKPTSGAAAAVTHAAFFLVCGVKPLVPRLLNALPFTMLGALVNVGYLTIRSPRWFSTVLDGVVWSQQMNDRHLLESLRAVPWVVPHAARIHALPIGLLCLSVVIARYASRAGRRYSISYLAPIIVAMLSWLLSAPGAESTWMVLVALVAATLWCIGMAHRARPQLYDEDRSLLSLAILVFVLPVCYSIGTGIALVEHTRMAIVFPLSFVTVLLSWLHLRNVISQRAVRASIAILALPALAVQVLPLVGRAYTYRLRSSLLEQKTALDNRLPFRGLSADSVTSNDLTNARRGAHSAGFKEKDGVLDFTGDSPGIVYAVGGRPLGVPWMLGGYPGSEAAASVVLDKLTTQQLRRAWILSSETSERRIQRWEQLMKQRLGSTCFEIAATLKIRPSYSWSGPDSRGPRELTLWRPLLECRP
jgi:hypothetical protein